MDVLFEMNDGVIDSEMNKDICLYVQGGEPSKEEEKMLHAMMSAIHVDMEKAIIRPYNLPIERLENNFKTIFIFGLIPGSLDNMVIHLNHPIVLEGRIILATYNLASLIDDKNKKLALWKILQATFLNR